MKKATTVFGIIALFFVLIGIIFKIQHWPGGGIALVLGLGLFSALFQIMLFIYNMLQPNSGLVKATQSFGALAALTYTTGVLYRIQHWPGSGILTLAGTFFFFIFIPLFLIAISKPDSPLRQLNVRSVICLSIIGLMLGGAIGANGPSYTAINNFLVNAANEKDELRRMTFFNEPRYSEMEKRMLNGSVDSVRKFSDRALATKKLSDDLVKYIENIKFDLLRYTEGIDTITDINSSSHPDNYDIPTHYLIGDDTENPTGKAAELKKKMNEFKEALMGFIDPKIREKNSLGLSTGDFYSRAEQRTVNWETANFYHNSLAGVITTLTQIQVKVRLAEAQIVDVLLYEARGNHI